ncbi:hypothetical protein SETIT_7G069700v2 [Setaria italica]|uniref:Uncharacterized protein n=1 Tax=Setaria italica TaxID=4555 RepID=A0A368RT62_SETIT|nr:hypothetical protein SETIT_7G069700v2 [Setaria italica]
MNLAPWHARFKPSQAFFSYVCVIVCVHKRIFIEPVGFHLEFPCGP